jgi:MerR family transcriptional regulator, redox-sensitive transcriptional activator SoxR
MEALSIGEVSARSGVPESTLRYYERIGVLSPPLRIGGRRRYTPDVLQALLLIRLGRAVGFTLAELRALREGAGDGPADTQWGEALSQKLRHTRSELDRLRLAEHILQAVLECGCDDLADCSELSDTLTRLTDAH